MIEAPAQTFRRTRAFSPIAKSVHECRRKTLSALGKDNVRVWLACHCADVFVAAAGPPLAISAC